MAYDVEKIRKKLMQQVHRRLSAQELVNGHLDRLQEPGVDPLCYLLGCIVELTEKIEALDSILDSRLDKSIYHRDCWDKTYPFAREK